jgi:hypothetical protein
MSTRDEVETAVVATLAGFTRLSPSRITPDLPLQKSPLSLDSNRLAFLATSLRGYVKFHSHETETLLVSEVRKSGLSVAGLVDLIFKKVATHV